MRTAGSKGWRRRTIAVGPASISGLTGVPSSAPAQTAAPAAELPPIDVVAPSPLGGTRSARPKAVASPIRRARTIRAPGAPAETAAAPTAGSAGPAVPEGGRDITLIDRDKVPSNTA